MQREAVAVELGRKLHFLATDPEFVAPYLNFYLLTSAVNGKYYLGKISLHAIVIYGKRVVTCK